MKMNDIVSEEGLRGKALNWVIDKGTDLAKRLDPTQKWRGSPTVYSDKAAKSAEKIADKNAQTAVFRDPAEQRIKDTSRELARVQGKDTHAVIPKDSKLPVPKAEYEKQLQTRLAKDQNVVKQNPKLDPPPKDAYSKGRLVAPTLIGTGLTNQAVKYATATPNNPEGISLAGELGSLVSGGTAGGFKAIGDFTSGLGDPAFDTGSSSSARDSETNIRPDPAATAKESSIKESINDILKLAGTKSITERDNVTGLVKVKEIKQLNESQDLNECGMMPSGNTTASLSINATAGSGEEVANMLKSLMDLAGVKPVTGSMLGSMSEPMPMVKAIDIISAPKHDHDDHDSMEPQDDEMNKKPLTGSMEEEYANTPADPTDVPKYDPEKMVFRPNQAQQGDRMDGTMPKGNPGMSESSDLTQSLLKEYEAFKNGQ